MITSEVFVAHAQCQLKSYSLLRNKKANSNEYVSILEERVCSAKRDHQNTIKQKFPNAKPYSAHGIKQGEDILFDINLEADGLSAHADVLIKQEHIFAHHAYIPTIVVGNHKINKEHRLQLAFVSYVLSKIQKQKPDFGRIVGGDKKVHRIKTEFLYHEVEKNLRKIRGWKSGKIKPPSIILNRHCPYCSFQKECELDAKEKDHLSQLRGMSEKEIITQNKRGIFTVTQFAYTYRARKQSKIHKNKKYYHSLKALAIRDKKIYNVEQPEIPQATAQIFLDVEGVPEQNFYYLIGLVVVEHNNPKQFSFWADSENEEIKIYKEFIEVINNYNDFVLFHYGSFENQFFARMGKKYGDNKRSVEILENVQTNSINILSMIYGKIYFPTYSNSLKEIAKYLGWNWSDVNASGLQSLVWRHHWEKSRDSHLKETLIQYNLDDCYALKIVLETIAQISDNKYFENESVSYDTIPNETTYKFGPNNYLFQEFEFVNRCAYFDYQREKVFFRGRNKKKIKTREKKQKHPYKFRINKKIEIPIPQKCERCGSTMLYRHGRKHKTVYDVKFFDFGVKRWVIKYGTSRVRCRSCLFAFPPPEYHNIKSKYGYFLKIWVVYQIIVLRQTYNRIYTSLWSFFRYRLGSQIIQKFKYEIADYYSPTYQQIIDKLKNGKLIHADETSVSIRGKKSYVWILTSLEEVLYIYSPTREGKTLNEILINFSGVLVSDFYGVYDSFECPQQKCLIHLIRDINDDLRKNPFDVEYKNFMKDFGELLKKIVLTVDKYGLKKRYLKKHKKEAEKFINHFLSPHSISEVTIQYQKRFRKYKRKLFAFLDYDGIPWNNNNAEHAVKSFALYRKVTDGCFTETGIKKYLMLLSIYQTCQYKKLDFLDFLRTKEVDLDKYCSRK